MTSFTESLVEQAALAWLEHAGWRVRSGTGIASGEPVARHDAYGQMVVARRLRESLLPPACSDLRREASDNFLGKAV